MIPNIKILEKALNDYLASLGLPVVDMEEVLIECAEFYKKREERIRLDSSY